MTTRLGVNIDHVATIRNARGGNHPNPFIIAKDAIKFGADILPDISKEPVNICVSSGVFPNKVEPLVKIMEALSISVCISWAVNVPPTTISPVIEAFLEMFRLPKEPVEALEPLTSPFFRIRK